MPDRPPPDSPESLVATPDEYMDSNPVSPGSIDESSEASTPLDPPSASPDSSSLSGSDPSHAASSPDLPRRVPSLRTVSDPQGVAAMSSSSTLSGVLQHARRPPPVASNLPLDLMQKARALQQQRMGLAGRPALSPQSSGSSVGSPQSGVQSPIAGISMLPGGVPAGLQLPGGMGRPMAHGFPRSAPVVPSAVGRRPGPSLSERRQMKLGGLPGSPMPPQSGTPKLSDMDGGGTSRQGPGAGGQAKLGSKLTDFQQYIDAEKGWITFDGAATITRTGVNFANGQTFKISLDEIQVLDELGKGNYGTVYKVRHARPNKPRFGPGLSGFKSASSSRQSSMSEKEDESESSPLSQTPRPAEGTTTGVVMAMKELRLELDEAKFTTILKELVILHECVSPYIIDFYGAFFQEGAVYICIEYMDGGSIDKLYTGGIPEPVLRKITYATIMGLKTLKDDHHIIHRDVKPTNILANTRGQIKICDFGVSGNLVASIAKTNIGCQSYMAPERISGGDMAVAGTGADGTYSVQSDIWSLGLTIIECAMGRYPYPPEVSSTIFSQLSAIVEGDPPDLPEEGYSAVARDFVRSCLNKNPRKRHTYPMLLAHPWMKPLAQPATITEDDEAEEASENDALADATGQLNLGDGTDGEDIVDAEVAAWVRRSLDNKSREDGGRGGAKQRPALHAAPLDSVSPASSPPLVAPQPPAAV